jgi:hypothetical protein
MKKRRKRYTETLKLTLPKHWLVWIWKMLNRDSEVGEKEATCIFSPSFFLTLLFFFYSFTFLFFFFFFLSKQFYLKRGSRKGKLHEELEREKKGCEAPLLLFRQAQEPLRKRTRWQMGWGTRLGQCLNLLLVNVMVHEICSCLMVWE